MGTVEAKGPGLDLRHAGAAAGAGKLLGIHELVAAFNRHLDQPVPLPQRRFHRLGYPAHFDIRADDQPVHHKLDVMPLLLVQLYVVHLVQHVDLIVDPYPDEPRLAGRFKYLFVLPLLAADLGRQQHDAAVFWQGRYGVDNLGNGLPLHGQAALGTVRRTYAGEQQPQVIVNLGDRSHGGPRVVGNAFLVDGDCRGQTFDVIYIRLVHAAQELAGVG